MAEYKYGKNKNFKLLAKLSCVGLIVIGAIFFAYTFFPLISWHIYFAPSAAAQKIASPIPVNNVISSGNISSLITSATGNVGSDFTNANNWYPGFESHGKNKADYTISIPKIDLTDVPVTNRDYDLTKHLVQYNSDTHPPKSGNSVIFGHSTLPQLFNRNDYKTIFANLYKIGVGDEITVKIDGKTYTYKVESVTVVEPEDTSPLAQNFTDSFLTIITCTPPGTIWKRLIVKARIQEF